MSDLPRALSLELSVLPISGGQRSKGQFYARSIPKYSVPMELRGVEPLTSAVRLQRSPN